MSNPNLNHELTRLRDWQHRALAEFLARGVTTHDPAEKFLSSRTFGERVADAVASFGGSWPFIFLFLGGMAVWMVYNQSIPKPFDPFPYILLNLVLSCLAALQAPVIMMSQNRQSARDRMDAQHDYEVNLRAEMEVMGLHTKLDEMRDQKLVRLEEMVRLQSDTLQRMEKILADLDASRPH